MAAGVGLVAVSPTLEFPGVPRFSPEHFARIRIADPLRRKQLDTGLQQLSEEGAAQVFYSDEHLSGGTPIVGAVGQLQFDVLLHRLEHEYGVRIKLDRLSFDRARWVTGPADAIQRAGQGIGRLLVYDSKELPLILFENGYTLRTVQEREKELEFHAVAP